MKALIIGCNGLLGQNLLRALPAGWEATGAGIETESVSRQLAGYRHVDITQRPDLDDVIAVEAPDLILNAAALTDVDLGEREQELCTRLNRDCVGWMAASRIPMVHISSDYVFDGEAGPYSETDPVNPLSHYGRTKLESEALALSGCAKSIVVRTMTLWGKSGGPGKGGKTSFVEFVRSSLAGGKTVRIVTDQFGNPTLAEDLAIGIWKLVLGGKKGLYHVAGSEWNSRFQWAEAIADFYALDKRLIQPCLTSDLQQLARRPLKSGLRCEKLARDTGFIALDVAGQLRRVDESA